MYVASSVWLLLYFVVVVIVIIMWTKRTGLHQFQKEKKQSARPRKMYKPRMRQRNFNPIESDYMRQYDSIFYRICIEWYTQVK